MRNSDDALRVNWCEATVTDSKGKVVYRNAWATSHRSLLPEAGFKPPQAAAVKSRGSERWGQSVND